MPQKPNEDIQFSGSCKGALGRVERFALKDHLKTVHGDQRRGWEALRGITNAGQDDQSEQHNLPTPEE